MVTRVAASKSRLFRLRAKIGCPTFLIYLQLQCHYVYINKQSHPLAQGNTEKHIIFTRSCCFSAYKPSFPGNKIK